MSAVAVADAAPETAPAPGWTVTDVSFYTTDCPSTCSSRRSAGCMPTCCTFRPAITYTLVVITGGLLARGRATGREGIVRMLIAAGIMIAPQLGPGVYILIFQPDHVGTQVPLLLTWLVLDRGLRGPAGETPRFTRAWYVPVLVGAMLTWVTVADRLVLLTGVAPVSDMSARSWLAVESMFGLYGADFFGESSPGLAAAIAFLHLFGLALAVWALWLVVGRFFGCEDRIAQVLALGILINVAAYLLSTVPTTYWSARDPQAHDANFVVLMNPAVPLDEIADRQVCDAFGRPNRVYDVGSYVIMTYDHNLLTDLSPSLPPAPSSGSRVRLLPAG